jgi:hypothetical protein
MFFTLMAQFGTQIRGSLIHKCFQKLENAYFQSFEADKSNENFLEPKTRVAIRLPTSRRILICV